MTYVEECLELLEDKLHYSFGENLAKALTPTEYELLISFTKVAQKGKAFTEKQGKCAMSLVMKYADELLMEGVDVVEDTPIFRQPLRIVDRKQYISIEDDVITIYFSWNGKFVDDIREYKNTTSIGTINFNRISTRWEFALNEANLTWVVTWGRINNFVIDQTVESLYDKVIECENTPYSIRLVPTDNGYTIHNAAQSLIEYIDNNLGGFGSDNVDVLVDYAGILGYKIDESITDANPLIQVFGANIKEFLTPTIDNLESVLEYANITQRFPIVLYYPSVSRNRTAIMQKILEFFQVEDIIITEDMKRQWRYDPNDFRLAKLIFIDSMPDYTMLDAFPNQIPLLISYNQLLLNGHNSSRLTAAERVIYMCKTKIIN